MSVGHLYNQYSPYYQQDLGQDGSRSGSSCSISPHQPLNVCQPQSQQPATQTTNTSSSAYVYGNVSSAGRQPAQEARSGYADGRLSVDATNLGYLANATNLGRDETSPQQGSGYGSSSNTYGLSAAASASAGHNRVDSRGATAHSKAGTSETQTASQNSYPTYQAPSNAASSYSSQAYNSNTGSNSPARTPQFAPAQSSHTPSQSYVATQQAFQHAQPTGGQAIQNQSSWTAPPAVQSPRFAASQNTAYPVVGTLRDRSSLGPTQPPSTQYQTNRPFTSDQTQATGSISYTPPQQTASGYRQTGRNNTGTSNQHGNASSTYSPAQNQQGQSTAIQEPPDVHTPVNAQSSQQSTPVESYHPATVDPNQVFNHYEFQKKQDAEAEKRRAAEARRTAQTTMPSNRAGDYRPPSVTSQSSDVLQAARAAIGNTTDVDSAKRDQMELEMKQMIEKMRDYKAKDPSLFSQIWEQVKKVSPSSCRLVFICSSSATKGRIR